MSKTTKNYPYNKKQNGFASDALLTRPFARRYMQVLRVSILAVIFLPMVSISSEQEPQCDVQGLIDELSEKKSIEDINEIEELWRKLQTKLQDEDCVKSTFLPIDDETLRKLCGDEPCAIFELSKEE